MLYVAWKSLIEVTPHFILLILCFIMSGGELGGWPLVAIVSAIVVFYTAAFVPTFIRYKRELRDHGRQVNRA